MPEVAVEVVLMNNNGRRAERGQSVSITMITSEVITDARSGEISRVSICAYVSRRKHNTRAGQHAQAASAEFARVKRARARHIAK